MGTNPARNGAKRKVPMRKVALKIGIRAVLGLAQLIVNKALDRLYFPQVGYFLLGLFKLGLFKLELFLLGLFLLGHILFGLF